MQNIFWLPGFALDDDNTPLCLIIDCEKYIFFQFQSKKVDFFLGIDHWYHL